MAKSKMLNLNVPGPVQKLAFLGEFAAQNKKLTRTDLAILMVLANGMNAQTGVHFRSFQSFAHATASSTRSVKSAMAKLIKSQIVEMVQQGNRYGRASTYTLNLRIAEQLDELMASEGSDTAGEGLVKHNDNPSEIHSKKVVSETAPLSMILSETISRKEQLGSERPETSGVALAPLVSGTEYKHPEFWKAFQRKTSVAEAEKYLDELARTHNMATIVAGAARYTAYSMGNHRLTALQFLEKEKWHDDWACLSSKGKVLVRSRNDPLKNNMAYQEWLKHPLGTEFEQIDLKMNRLTTVDLISHLRECKKCKAACKDVEPDFFDESCELYFDDFYIDKLCGKGKGISTEYDKLNETFLYLKACIEKENGPYDFSDE
jgi:hypothetical protein